MASPTCDYLIYYESLAYLIPRLLIWAALSGVVIADAFIHKHIKRRGWQLHVGICVVIAFFVVQDILLLTYSIGSRSGLSALDNVCKAFIFFSDLADSLFIVLLLAIAAGYCITRDTLGPYKVKVLVIPTVYFLTTMISDYIANSPYALDVNANAVEMMNLLVSLVALLLAWVYIFDTVQRERELLEGPKEGIVGAAGLQDPSQVAHTTTVFPPDRKDSSKGTDVESGEMAGQSVSLPPQMVLEAAEGRNVGDMYAPMQGSWQQSCCSDASSSTPPQGEDTDKPKTIEDQMQLRSKVRLMKQFQWGVAAYVVAKAAVILLPAFIWAEPGDKAISTIYILQNCVRWLFLAAMCWVFRPREDNPYLLLEEAGEGHASELHTELGLVQSDSRADLENGRGNESPISIDRNFSLGDLDDEDDTQKPASGPPSPRRPNKSVLTNQQSMNDSEQPSQSSSPRHSRPVPPPKPSGKKD